MSEAVGELIDRMSEIREQRRELAKEDKLLSAQYQDLETSLLDALDATNQVGGQSKVASATITETEIANVTDWDKFHSWLRKTNRLYMLERRPSQAAYREFIKDSRGHKPPPGVETFVKRTISLRNK